MLPSWPGAAPSCRVRSGACVNSGDRVGPQPELQLGGAALRLSSAGPKQPRATTTKCTLKLRASNLNLNKVVFGNGVWLHAMASAYFVSLSVCNSLGCYSVQLFKIED